MMQPNITLFGKVDQCAWSAPCACVQWQKGERKHMRYSLTHQQTCQLSVCSIYTTRKKNILRTRTRDTRASVKRISLFINNKPNTEKIHSKNVARLMHSTLLVDDEWQRVEVYEKKHEIVHSRRKLDHVRVELCARALWRICGDWRAKRIRQVSRKKHTQ